MIWMQVASKSSIALIVTIYNWTSQSRISFQLLSLFIYIHYRFMWHHRIRSVIFQFCSIVEQNKGPSSNHWNVCFAIFVDQIVTNECHGRFGGYMHSYHSIRDQCLLINWKIHMKRRLSIYLIEINLKSNLNLSSTHIKSATQKV